MSDPLRIVFLDNVDSFTYNLVDEFARRGHAVAVYRNHQSADLVHAALDRASRRSLLVVSPGPGTPAAAGCALELIRRAAPHHPVFGVCLGHQTIVQAFGGRVDTAPSILHGKTSMVRHDGTGLFAGLPDPMPVGRYHSLAATTIPAELEPTALCDDIVMAVRHRRFPVTGVQFHPESVLTPAGSALLDNVITWARHAGR